MRVFLARQFKQSRACAVAGAAAFAGLLLAAWCVLPHVRHAFGLRSVTPIVTHPLPLVLMESSASPIFRADSSIYQQLSSAGWQHSEIVSVKPPRADCLFVHNMSRMGEISSRGMEAMIVFGSQQPDEDDLDLTAHRAARILGHAQAWRVAIERNQPVVVLETGQRLTTGARAAVHRALQAMPTRWGILHLRATAASSSLPTGILVAPGESVECDPRGYVVSPGMASWLLSDSLPLDAKLERYMCDRARWWTFSVLFLRVGVLATDDSFVPSPVSPPLLPPAPLLKIPMTYYALCPQFITTAENCQAAIDESSVQQVLNSADASRAAGQQIGAITNGAKAGSLYWPGAWQVVPVLHSVAKTWLTGRSHSQVTSLALLPPSLRHHALCSGVLVEKQGGVCAPVSLRLLRSPRPMLHDAQLVVGSDWYGNALGSFMAATPGSPALRAMLKSMTSQSTSADVMAVLESMIGVEAAIRILPPQYLQPLQRMLTLPARWPVLQPRGFSPVALAYEPATPVSLGTIPRILHFVWISGNVPAKQARLIRLWLEFHPAWQVRLWTGDDFSDLQLAPVIAASSDMRQKADIARYELMWREGGLYVDADFEVIRPFDTWVEGTHGLVCHENGEKQIAISLSNGFFGFAPRHPLMRRAMAFAERAILNTADVNMRTGPRMFRAAMGDELRTLTVLPPDLIYPVEYDRRDIMAGWGCSKQACGHRFRHAYAVHLWSLPTDQRDPEKSVPLATLKAEFAEHNRAVYV